MALPRAFGRMGQVLSECFYAEGSTDSDNVEGRDRALSGEDPEDEA